MQVRNQKVIKPPASPVSYHLLHRSQLARVEDLATKVRTRGRGVAAFAARRHIVLPYRGSFQWHVGGWDVVADPTQVLFVESGEEYHISHPVSGDASLVLWPEESMLDEMMHSRISGSSCASQFQRRSRLASFETKLLAHQVRQAAWQGADPLALDELTIDLLGALTSDANRCRTYQIAPHAKINLARVYLQQYHGDPISLSEVANAVGLSAVYLTQAFTRMVGTSMYRYLVRIRLAEALNRIPKCDDLTDLAMDLGFSSHSHFSATFRGAFGTSPSVIRNRFRKLPELATSKKVASGTHPGFNPKPLELCVARSNMSDGIRWTPDDGSAPIF
ncbi:MAG: AraC family transcriptional regulator [Sphingorhabdus sp.]|uniref:helix-turn-helix domain-containing protein n=1 Tax=Sphingorhabdus sp. TaxID=1902408 RepID=UPI003C824029